MKTLRLEGAKLHVLGAFPAHGRRAEVVRLLEQGGAHVVGKMAPSVDAVIRGGGVMLALERAEAFGIPVLEEPELTTLLHQGWVEIQEGPVQWDAGDAELDALMGDVRGALARGPSREVWDELLACVERCAPEQLPALVGYLEAGLSGWTGRATWLRAQPRSWIPALTRGQHSPAYRLLRRLDLTGASLTTPEVRQALACEGLEGLRWLSVATHDVLGKTGWRALRAFSALEHLCVGDVKAAYVPEIEDVRWPSLTSFGWSPSHFWEGGVEDFRVLWSAASLAKVERLVLTRMRWSVSFALEVLAEPACLPALRHLELDVSDFGRARGPLLVEDVTVSLTNAPEAALARIETLTLRSRLTGQHRRQGVIGLGALSRLKTLRLLGAGLWEEGGVPRGRWDRVFHPAMMMLPESLEVVEVSEQPGRGALGRLARLRPELEIRRV